MGDRKNFFSALGGGDSDEEDAAVAAAAPKKQQQQQQQQQQQASQQKLKQKQQKQNNAVPQQQQKQKQSNGGGGGGGQRQREFDRRSGTGRGKEVSKGGAGGRNWGGANPRDAARAEAAAAEDVRREIQESGEEQAEGAEDAQVQAQGEEEEEEEDAMTLEEYELQRQARRLGSAFEEKELRKASELPAEGVAYQKVDGGEEAFIESAAKKKAARAKRDQTKKMLNVNFVVRDEGSAGNNYAPRGRRGDRGGGRGSFRGGRGRGDRGGFRGGRGGGRGGRGRGGGFNGGRGVGRGAGRGSARLDPNDMNSFPSL